MLRSQAMTLMLCGLMLGGCPPTPAPPVTTGGGHKEPVSQGPPVETALKFGVLTPNLKVRPADRPRTSPGATLKAARNEFEAFQIVFTAPRPVSGVSVKLARPLAGPGGAKIPAKNVVLYREAYYHVGTASNIEGGAGPWPDPLIPAVDTYVGQKRNAFPFEVPGDQSRVVWVDVLVPMDARPGRYEGALSVLERGQRVGQVPITLEVGNFTLPSTATLHSAFDMDYAQPCKAHTGNDTCALEWSEAAAYKMRERYIRAGLEHRFTIFNIFFQPPFGSADFATWMLPHVHGKGTSRLPGARVTSVRIDGNDQLARWVAFAKKHGYFDRLMHYPVDEPGDDNDDWTQFKTEAKHLHKIDPRARIIITSSIQDANKARATKMVDIFVPVINNLEDRRATGSDYSGNQLKKYQRWLKARPNRLLWGYQSCMSHGCGKCGEPSPDKSDTGWPNRVIDSGAVQNRAFPWVAFLFNLTGELYFEVAEQLNTAWNKNGQCKFSGSGDGTLFYPGKVSLIGGTSDIPIESIRIKMIREGMEDYEYLALLAKKDRARARAIARELFPHAYQCDQPPKKLEAARSKLFDLLNVR